MNEEEWAANVVAALSGIAGSPDSFTKEEILEMLKEIILDAPIKAKVEAMRLLLTLLDDDKDNI